MKKWKIHVIPHTHWDREWFFSQSRANTLFANNIKDIVSVLQKDPDFKSFVLDGQVSVLNDYFKEFKTLKPAIEKLANEKRLLLGPWYSQPDMFSSLGESIIRNLERGTMIANELGNCLDIAYLPDSFGFNANLPQIFSYFDLKQMIFWRGMKKEDNDKTIFFNWRGIDGSSIPAYCYNFGYWMFSSFFPYPKVKQSNLTKQAPEIFAKTLPILAAIKARSQDTNNQILFPFGQDESPITKFLPELISIFNQLDEEHEWVLSDFKTFFKSVPSTPQYQINTSLIWPYVARIHRTITTSRYDIKQLFRNNENFIYHQLEPLQVIYRQVDPHYQASDVVKEALHKLLASQAHDSLGSCNSDLTNDDIVNRLKQAQEIITAEIDILMKKIYYRLGLDQESDLLVFNLAPYKVKKLVIDRFINSPNAKIKITGSAVSEAIVINTQAKKTLASLNDYYQHQVRIVLDDVAGFSYQILKIIKADVKTSTPLITSPKQGLIISESTINYQAINHKLITNLFVINPYGDHGDSYDFSPDPKGYDSLKTSVHNKIIKEVKTATFDYLKFEHVVHYGNDQKQTFLIEISRSHNTPYDLVITTNNHSKDIKWILEFNLDIEFQDLDDIKASQSLALMNRTNITEPDWVKKGYKEKPALLSTNDGLIIVPKANDFTLLTWANNEYSVKDNRLAITLFRTYAYLGRANLAWRPGRLSGMNIPTPGSLLQQRLTFKFRFDFGIKNYTTLLNNWFLKPISYHHNDPNRIDAFDDRFIIDCDLDNLLPNFNLDEIEIDPEFLISNFRISPLGNYELRVSNLTNQAKLLTLTIAGVKKRFRFSRKFLKLESETITEILLAPQKFITINFTI